MEKETSFLISKIGERYSVVPSPHTTSLGGGSGGVPHPLPDHIIDGQSAREWLKKELAAQGYSETGYQISFISN